MSPEQGCLVLLRLPEERRRDHVRARGRASRLRRGGRAARGARRHHAALRRRVVLRRTASASNDCTRRCRPRSTSTTSCLLESPDGGTRAPLPAQPRLRRRRGAPVLARLGARRLRPAERAPAEGEVLARRHRRRRARVREQGEQAAGLVPRPADVPDLGHARRAGRLRRPHARRDDGPKYKNTAETRSTRSRGCSTA